MIYDIAVSGVQCKTSWEGTLHSNFENAVNIITDKGLFTVLYNPLWISETNMVTNKHLSEQLHSAREICSDGSFIYIGSMRVASFEKSAVWQMPPVSGRAVRPDCLQKVELQLPNIEINDTTVYISKIFSEAVRSFMKKSKAGFEAVIGAGHGLTPSGDDMLTGFALALLHGDNARLAELSRLCTPLLSTTTDISRHLLLNAFNGKFTAPLVNLMLSMQSGHDLEKNLETALNIGSSSGRDGVYGLITGLKLLNSE